MRDDSLRFQDIRDAIANIEKYSNCSRQEFMQNELVQVLGGSSSANDWRSDKGDLFGIA